MALPAWSAWHAQAVEESWVLPEFEIV
jgi:hypothetical protein